MGRGQLSRIPYGSQTFEFCQSYTDRVHVFLTEFSLKRFLSRYWFLVGLFLVIGIASIFPELGVKVRREGWILNLVIATILFISGLLLNLKNLAHQALNFRAMSFAFTITFLVGPLLGAGLAKALMEVDGIDLQTQQHFYEAVYLAACQASTLASSIALTRMAKGQSELALLLALFSNVLTVVLTPLALRLGLGVNVEFSVWEMMLRIGLVILMPAILGQCLGLYLKKKDRRIPTFLKPIPQALILVFAFVGFASAVPRFQQVGDLVIRFLVASVGLHLGLSLLAFLGSRLFRLSKGESIAVFYNASQKTVPNGIYIWESYFSSNPLGAVPLVFIQLTQLSLGFIYAPLLEKWVGENNDSNRG